MDSNNEANTPTTQVIDNSLYPNDLLTENRSRVTDRDIEMTFLFEELRQSQLAFDQSLRHADRRMALQTLTVCSGTVTFCVIALVSCYVLLKSSQFPASAVITASATVLTQVVSVLASSWKLLIKQETSRVESKEATVRKEERLRALREGKELH